MNEMKESTFHVSCIGAPVVFDDVATEGEVFDEKSRATPADEALAFRIARSIILELNKEKEQRVFG